MTRSVITRLSFVAALSIVGCGSGPLVGDWFGCRDALCGELDDDGVRFSGDRWAALDAPGSRLEPGERYTLGSTRGFYTYDGLTLRLGTDGSAREQVVRVEVEGSLLIMKDANGGSACTSTPGGQSNCTSTKADIRMVRVGDGGAVPMGSSGSGPGSDDPPPLVSPPGTAPTPVPAPDEGGQR